MFHLMLTKNCNNREVIGTYLILRPEMTINKEAIVRLKGNKLQYF